MMLQPVDLGDGVWVEIRTAEENFGFGKRIAGVNGENLIWSMMKAMVRISDGEKMIEKIIQFYSRKFECSYINDTIEFILRGLWPIMGDMRCFAR